MELKNVLNCRKITTFLSVAVAAASFCDHLKNSLLCLWKVLGKLRDQKKS
jgi:hypothetical protein